jgi:hypothetical protein
MVFPQELLELVPAEQRGKACICRSCVEKFHRRGREQDGQ